MKERLQRSAASDPVDVYQKRSVKGQPPLREENMGLDSYQSVHADKFKPSPGKGRAEEDFSLVTRPDGDAEREAYKNASYQARLRIERASRRTSQAIEPGAVDSSHR